MVQIEAAQEPPFLKIEVKEDTLNNVRFNRNEDNAGLVKVKLMKSGAIKTSASKLTESKFQPAPEKFIIPSLFPTITSERLDHLLYKVKLVFILLRKLSQMGSVNTLSIVK